MEDYKVNPASSGRRTSSVFGRRSEVLCTVLHSRAASGSVLAEIADAINLGDPDAVILTQSLLRMNSQEIDDFTQYMNRLEQSFTTPDRARDTLDSGTEAALKHLRAGETAAENRQTLQALLRRESPLRDQVVTPQPDIWSVSPLSEVAAPLVKSGTTPAPDENSLIDR